MIGFSWTSGKIWSWGAGKKSFSLADKILGIPLR